MKVFFWRMMGCFTAPWRRYQFWRYKKSHTALKLHLGAGDHQIKGWFNTDMKPVGGSLFVDAEKKFPFPNDIFEVVFSEHLIEHLDYARGTLFLHECFRVMRPGGKIRIATPDLCFLIELGAKKTSELQGRYIRWSIERYLPGIQDGQAAFVINNFFRDWGHRFIYDFQTLKMTLEKLGFVSVMSCVVGESQDPQLSNLEGHGCRIPPEFNRLETMVLEAVKPG